MTENLVNYLKDYISTTAGAVGIRLEERDVRRLFGALDRLTSRVRYQSNNVPRLNSVDFMQLVVGNIVSQKYMTGYAEYSPGYKKWKSKQALQSGYWRLADDLTKAITYYRVPIAKGGYAGSYAWFSGVPSGAMDSGGSVAKRYGSLKSKEISWYGAIMEKGSWAGGQRHPARPIFKPTLLMYRGSGFRTRGAEALQSLKRYWH